MCPVTQKFKKISQRKNPIFDSFKRDRTKDEIAQFFLRATDNDLLKLFEKISAMNPDQVNITKIFNILYYYKQNSKPNLFREIWDFFPSLYKPLHTPTDEVYEGRPTSG